MYLSNDIADQKRRKILMSQCMQFLKNDFNQSSSNDRTDAGHVVPAEYLGPDHSYLDMTISGFCTSTPIKSKIISTHPANNSAVISEYVGVNSPAAIVEVDNDNYVEATSESSNGNPSYYYHLTFENGTPEKADETTSELVGHSDECPFGGLPAAHLSLRQVAHKGWLAEPRKYRTDKRVYAGVVDGWLLIYSGESALRPSAHFALRRCNWTELIESPDKCHLTLITDQTKNKKRSFQMNSQQELKTWTKAFADSKATACANLFGTRKLPTPPPNVESVDVTSSSLGVNEGSSDSTISLEDDSANVDAPPKRTSKIYINQSNSGECIYEEPKELLTKRQQIPVPPSQEYDIPNPIIRPVTLPEPLTQESTGNSCISEHDAFEVKKSKVAAQFSPSPPLSPLAKPIEKNLTNETPADQTKHSNMRLRLYKFTLNFIQAMTRSSRGRESSDSKKCLSKPALDHKNDNVKSDEKVVSTEKRVEKTDEVEVEVEVEAEGGEAEPSPKRSKVNDIINRLEATGHRAPMFSLTINRSKLTKLKTTKSSGDEHNYEPVAVVTT